MNQFGSNHICPGKIAQACQVKYVCNTRIRKQVSPCRNCLEDSSRCFLTGSSSLVAPSTFFSEGRVPGNALGSRGDWRSDHGSGSVSELAGGLLQRFPTRADLFLMLMPPLLRMTTDPDPCRKAKAGGSRMLMLGGRDSWKPMRNYVYPCRKAKAAGSRMLISGDQHMVTQQEFEPLANQNFSKTKWFTHLLTRHAC